jgi:hypothetical protein
LTKELHGLVVILDHDSHVLLVEGVTLKLVVNSLMICVERLRHLGAQLGGNRCQLFIRRRVPAPSFPRSDLSKPTQLDENRPVREPRPSPGRGFSMAGPGNFATCDGSRRSPRLKPAHSMNIVLALEWPSLALGVWRLGAPLICSVCGSHDTDMVVTGTERR